MLCQLCYVNDASFFLSKNINGHKKELHLCVKCAHEQGILQVEKEPFSFHKFVVGMINGLDSFEKKHSSAIPSIECSSCYLTLHEFAKHGKLGCENCYKTFYPHLQTVIKNFQSGNIRHFGKIPKQTFKGIDDEESLNKEQMLMEEIAKEKKLLASLVTEEKFELAAIARDKIRELEKGLQGGDKDGL